MTSSSRHDLPSGWANLFLEDITSCEQNSIKRGPFGSAIKKEYFQPSGYKVYEQQNAIYNNFELGKYFIGDNKFNELQDFEVKPGDLLISCSGTIGKIAILPENAPRGIINQALLKITLDNRIVFSKYFTYLFASQAFQKTVLDKTRGTAIKNIASVKDLKQIPWPIPPINEQKRIVSKVEELFSFLDAGVASLRLVQAQLKRYRQAVLKAAFEGNLTRHNPEEPNLKILLSLIKEERKKIWQENQAIRGLSEKKYVEPKQAINEELPQSPSGWTWVRLEEICSIITDGTHITPKYFEKGVPFLSVKNVREGKILDNEVQYISEKEHQFLTKNVKPEFEDILYTKVGATIGRAAVVQVKYPFSIFVSLALIKPIKKFVLPKYLEYQLNSRLVLRQALSRKKGIAVPDLHLVEIRDFKILLTTPEEQQKVVSALDVLFVKIDKCEKSVEQELKRAETLRKSILTFAFSGKLVPQNLAEEPAEKLLERIKAERLTNKPKNIKVESSQYVK